MAGGDRGDGGRRGPGPGAGAVLGRLGPGRGRHLDGAGAAPADPRGPAPRGHREAARRARPRSRARPTWRPPRPGPRGRALAKTTKPTSLEGFLFPATYDITPDTTARQLVDLQVQAYKDNTANINYSYAPLEEPDQVRRADPGVDDRARGRAAQGAADRRGRALQPPQRQDAARHRRHHPVRDRAVEGRPDGEGPGDQVAVQHAPLRRAAAGADLQPGPRRDRRGRAAGEAQVTSTTSRATTAATATTSRPRRPSSRRTWPARGPTPPDDRRHHAGRGHHRLAGGALAVAGDAQRRVRGARPQLGLHGLPGAPGARARGDPRAWRPPACAGLNVTIPHKAAVVACCSSVSPAVEAIGAANTLVPDGDGRLPGRQHRRGGLPAGARRAGADGPGRRGGAGDRRRGRGAGRGLRPARARRPRARRQPDAPAGGRAGRPDPVRARGARRRRHPRRAGGQHHQPRPARRRGAAGAAPVGHRRGAGGGRHRLPARGHARGSPRRPRAGRGRWTAWGCCCTRARPRSSSGPAWRRRSR